MTLALTYLVVWMLGLLLYLLSFVQKLGWLRPLGLIVFAVGLYYWLPAGAHQLSIR